MEAKRSSRADDKEVTVRHVLDDDSPFPSVVRSMYPKARIEHSIAGLQRIGIGGSDIVVAAGCAAVECESEHDALRKRRLPAAADRARPLWRARQRLTREVLSIVDTTLRKCLAAPARCIGERAIAGAIEARCAVDAQAVRNPIIHAAFNALHERT